MNDLDRQFGRLLRNAATAPKTAATSALPFAVEARVLAAWRAGRAEGDDLGAVLRFFRYGLAAACAVALLAVAFSWQGVESARSDEFALTNAEINVAMLR
jgi:hypothetical protein